jgi:hypothetical protein
MLFGRFAGLSSQDGSFHPGPGRRLSRVWDPHLSGTITPAAHFDDERKIGFNTLGLQEPVRLELDPLPHGFTSSLSQSFAN